MQENTDFKNLTEKLDRLLLDADNVRLLEFAFNRKDIKDKILQQADPFMEHLMKAQLFHESSAYQTLYNIYYQLRKIRRADKGKHFDKQFYQENVAEGLVPDEVSYFEQASDIKKLFQKDYPISFSEDYTGYANASSTIIDLVFEEVLLDRDAFDNLIKQILE